MEDYLDMIYEMNPTLMEKPERVEVINFERPEVPMNRGQHQNNYSEFEPQDHLGYSVQREYSISDNNNRDVKEHDLLRWAQNEAHTQPALTLLPERVVADKLAKRKGPVENNGQIYQNILIGEMFNHAVQDHKKGVEQARELTERSLKEQAKNRRGRR